MVARAISVPRFTLLVGGLEDTCRSCRAPLLIGERAICRECGPALKRRALVRLAVSSLANTPDGAA